MSADSDRLPWWRYLGPWELRPVPVGILYFLFGGFAALTALTAMSGSGWDAFLLVAPGAFLSSGLVIAVLWLGRRYQLTHGLGLGGYLAITLLSSAVGIVIRIAMGAPLTPLIMGTANSAVGYVARSWGLMLVVLTIFGLGTRRLQQQVDLTTEALAQTREQQEWMLAADERVRRQVADALHDRVQAGIIAACLQLQGLPTSDPEAQRRVIQRLEDLRRLDVRGLARALSPAIAEVGLASALEDLASQYEPGLVATVAVDEAVECIPGEAGLQVRLGCYRIAEQALLNAAVHARAETCSVDVRVEGSEVVLRVADRGMGLGHQPHRPGLGSAVMTTWARALEGRWDWEPNASGGLDVVARLRPVVTQVADTGH